MGSARLEGHRRAGRLTIDEVQREPDLLVVVKHAVDEERSPGRFVVTGSANLLLLERVTESVAGWAAYLVLWPMTRRELLGLGTCGGWDRYVEHGPERWQELTVSDPGPRANWRDVARRGGYPPAAHDLTEAADRALWWEAYAATYLERDLRQLSAVENLVDFRRLMRASCLRLGGLLNQSELARDVALPLTTTQRYLNLLEVSYYLVRVQAWAGNRTKRLIKAPKVYWSDTGLALHLSGEPEERGAHLENVVLVDLLAWQGTRPDRVEIGHWRTAGGAEVDFVVEWPGGLLPVEVKTAARVRPADAAGLGAFLASTQGRCHAGLLLYGGEDTFWLTEGVLAAPWWRVV